MWGQFLGAMLVLALLVAGASIGCLRMLRADSWRDDMHRLWGNRYTSWDLRFRSDPNEDRPV